MNKISIIDYGLCNLYNVSNALDYLKAKVEIIEKPEDVTNATHLILPGVGAFKNGMRGLKIRNLIEPIKEHIDKDKPFLGICLGMQMMLSKSYEFGEISGLDIIDGEVVKIQPVHALWMQGFPQNFQLPNSRTESMKQLGNSVAVDAVKACADALIKHLKVIDSRSNGETNMAIKRNKGEWTELYTFLKLILDRKLSFCNEKLSPIDDEFIIFFAVLIGFN